MEIHPQDHDTPSVPSPLAELDRLGDEIADLSAHLEAATARLLQLIRKFDAQGGWTGFRSCAAWLGWRVGLTPGGRPGEGPGGGGSCRTPRCGR